MITKQDVENYQKQMIDTLAQMRQYIQTQKDLKAINELSQELGKIDPNATPQEHYGRFFALMTQLGKYHQYFPKDFIKDLSLSNKNLVDLWSKNATNLEDIGLISTKTGMPYTEILKLMGNKSTWSTTTPRVYDLIKNDNNWKVWSTQVGDYVHEVIYNPKTGQSMLYDPKTGEIKLVNGIVPNILPGPKTTHSYIRSRVSIGSYNMTPQIGTIDWEDGNGDSHSEVVNFTDLGSVQKALKGIEGKKGTVTGLTKPGTNNSSIR